jgi:hypothetical protein
VGLEAEAELAAMQQEVWQRQKGHPMSPMVGGVKKNVPQQELRVVQAREIQVSHVPDAASSSTASNSPPLQDC